METKPFNETKVGQWLDKNAPTVLNLASGFIPQPFKGTFNLLKNLVGAQPNLSPEQKNEFYQLADEHEKMILDDIANARSREVEIVKATGKKDLIMTYLALYGTLSPLAVLFYLIVFGFPDVSPGVAALLGGYIASLFSCLIITFTYYMGSTTGSKAKDETINTLSKS